MYNVTTTTNVFATFFFIVTVIHRWPDPCQRWDWSAPRASMRDTILSLLIVDCIIAKQVISMC